MFLTFPLLSFLVTKRQSTETRRALQSKGKILTGTLQYYYCYRINICDFKLNEKLVLFGGYECLGIEAILQIRKALHAECTLSKIKHSKVVSSIIFAISSVTSDLKMDLKRNNAEIVLDLC